MASPRPESNLEFKFEFKRELSHSDVLEGFRKIRTIPIVDLTKGLIDGDEEKTHLFYARRPFSKTEIAILAQWFEQTYPALCSEDKTIRQLAIDASAGRDVIVLAIILDENYLYQDKEPWRSIFKNKKEHVSFYYLATAEKKDPLVICQTDRGVKYPVFEKNPDKEKLQVAIDAGCPYGFWKYRTRLGYAYFDWDELIDGYNAAKAGVAEAQCWLGQAFISGSLRGPSSLRANKQQGKQWIAAAALQGNAYALIRYGFLIEDEELQQQFCRVAYEYGCTRPNSLDDCGWPSPSNWDFTLEEDNNKYQCAIRLYHHSLRDIEGYYISAKRKPSQYFTKLCLEQPEWVENFAINAGDKLEWVLSCVEEQEKEMFIQSREDFLYRIMHWIPYLSFPIIQIVFSYFSLFAPIVTSNDLTREMIAKNDVGRQLKENTYHALNMFVENAKRAANGEMSYTTVMRVAYQRR